MDRGWEFLGVAKVVAPAFGAAGQDLACVEENTGVALDTLKLGVVQGPLVGLQLHGASSQSAQ